MAGQERRVRTRREHPMAVRLTHWVAAAAMVAMIGSGWRIYDASPILPFVIPPGITIGGWLGGALLWHFAAMWALAGAGALYLLHGVLSGHFRRDLRLDRPGEVGRDLFAALRFRLHHRRGAYNAVQKLLYVVALLLAVGLVLTGLSIWKPVQFGAVTWLFGGYDLARRIHFFLMCGIVLFLVVHVALVVIVPRTLLAMVTGGARLPDERPRLAEKAS